MGSFPLGYSLLVVSVDVISLLLFESLGCNIFLLTLLHCYGISKLLFTWEISELQRIRGVALLNSRIVLVCMDRYGQAQGRLHRL
ncbi:hypothetical protein BGX38DRAFT_844677 [Terfezia claveryi]|nr:hypothetical protein BGX38DRAFT_844677 [Terfezia claveryi]